MFFAALRRLSVSPPTLILMLLAPVVASAGEITLSWDPSSDPRVTGYRLFVGNSSGEYRRVIDVGAVDRYRLQSLADGASYYFNLKAYDASGAESAFAGELTRTLYAPPDAALTVDVTSGPAPLTVQFRDNSTGTVTTRQWDFGNGRTSSAGTALVGFGDPGAYSIRLTVSGPAGTDTLLLADLITVTPPGGVTDAHDPPQMDDGLPPTPGDQPKVADAGPALPLEADELLLTGDWQPVRFLRPFVDPVVVAGPLEDASGGDEPAVVRIRNVTPGGFEIRAQRWQYQRGLPLAAAAAYLAVERGSHRLADGTLIEAGSSVSRPDGGLTTVGFDNAFGAPPVVLVSLNSDIESEPAALRIRALGPSGFGLILQEEEASDRLHAGETVDWLAWEPSAGVVDGLVFEVGRIARGVRHRPARLDFAGDLYEPPLLFGGIQTLYGGDPANLRWRDLSSLDVVVWIDEEQSFDNEVSHFNETVGYLLLAPL